LGKSNQNRREKNLKRYRNTENIEKAAKMNISDLERTFIFLITTARYIFGERQKIRKPMI
jgi:hypothetical protein